MEDSQPVGVPWPQDPWNEIIPGLWMGGQIATNGTSDRHPNVVQVRDEFDIVYSFYWRDEDGNGPDEGIPHVHHFIPDGELTDLELWHAKDYALDVAGHVQAGYRTLVRCQAGYNRSGLVVALALIEMGYSADEAIALIRENRSQHALHNEHFVRYILEAGS